MLLDLCAITWNDIPWLIDELHSEVEIDNPALAIVLRSMGLTFADCFVAGCDLTE